MFPSTSHELNLQPVSFLISSISSSLSNVDALDPMVKCLQVLKTSRLSTCLAQPEQLWKNYPPNIPVSEQVNVAITNQRVVQKFVQILNALK